VIRNASLTEVLSDGFGNLDMKSVGGVLAIGKANASSVAIGKASAFTDVLGNLEVRGTLTVAGIPTSSNNNFENLNTLLTKSQVASLIDVSAQDKKTYANKLIPKDKHNQITPLSSITPSITDESPTEMTNTMVVFEENELTLGDTYKIIIAGQIATLGTPKFSVGFHLLTGDGQRNTISIGDIIVPTTSFTSFQTDFQFTVMEIEGNLKLVAFGRVYVGAVVKSFHAAAGATATIQTTVKNTLSITGTWSESNIINSMVVSYIRVYKVH
jgi:hypothetical protein